MHLTFVVLQVQKVRSHPYHRKGKSTEQTQAGRHSGLGEGGEADSGGGGAQGNLQGWSCSVGSPVVPDSIWGQQDALKLTLISAHKDRQTQN